MTSYDFTFNTELDYTGVGAGSIKSTGQVLPNGLRLGESIQSLGTVIKNESGIIKGFNHNGLYHGLDQIITREVSPQVIYNTIKNPLATFAGRFDRTGYLSDHAYIVVDKAGQVVTAIGDRQFMSTIKNTLGRIKK